MTSTKQVALSHKTQETLAHGMLARFYADALSSFSELTVNKTTVADIVSAALEAKIEPEIMAGAYFVNVSGQTDGFATRLQFDLEFSKAIGSGYAKKFVAEVTRWEKQVEAGKEQRRKAPTLADVERISDRDRARTAAGKTVN